MSIIIPIHHTEDSLMVLTTLEGIKRTIGEKRYNIILVGTLPKDLLNYRIPVGWRYVETEAMLGDAKNMGAEYANKNYNPDVLVFLDAHMYFYDNESKDWGGVIAQFLKNNPKSIVSPAMSLYNVPHQRGFGVISEVTEENMGMDLVWRWWGSPKSNEPFEVPGLCGCFMAMTPETFEGSVCGYTPPLGIDDREFSIRMWILGYRLFSLPSLTVGHRFGSGYTDFSKERSIQWGMGMLLYTYLNMGEEVTKRLYEKDISGSQDKQESLSRATSQKWQSVRDELCKRRIRTAEDYFKAFDQDMHKCEVCGGGMDPCRL